MKNLFNSIKTINKTNNLLKLYIIIFSILNLIYWCLELYKNEFRYLFGAEEENKKEIFEKIMDISQISNNIELIIFYSNIVLLILFMMKDRRGKNGDLKKYFITNIFCMIFALIISFILSVIFKAPFGNLLQPNIPILMVTLVSLIYYAICSAYRFLISKNVMR